MRPLIGVIVLLIIVVSLHLGSILVESLVKVLGVVEELVLKVSLLVLVRLKFLLLGVKLGISDLVLQLHCGFLNSLVHLCETFLRLREHSTGLKDVIFLAFKRLFAQLHRLDLVTPIFLC